MTAQVCADGDAGAVAAVEVDDDPPEGDAIGGEEVTCADRKGRAQDAESCVAASWLSKYVSTGWSFPNGNTTAAIGVASGVNPEVGGRLSRAFHREFGTLWRVGRVFQRLEMRWDRGPVTTKSVVC